MKKLFNILASLFLNSFLLEAQTQEITSVYYDSYSFINNQWFTLGFSKSVNLFDNSKILIQERKNYLDFGYEGIPSNTIYQYDSKGRIIEKSVKEISSPKNTTITRRIYNDFDSLAVEKIWIIEDSLKTEILQQEVRYEYDAQKRLIKKIRFSNPKLPKLHNNPLELFGTYVYEYDEKNRIKAITYTYKNTINEANKTSYSYNSRGNLIEEIRSTVITNAPEIQTQGSDYQYDNFGNRMEVFRYIFNPLKQKEPLSKAVYSYDSQNRVVKMKGFYFFKIPNTFYQTTEENTVYNSEGLRSSYTFKNFDAIVNKSNAFDLKRIYEYPYLFEYYPDKKLKNIIYGRNIYTIDSLQKQSLYYRDLNRTRYVYETLQETNDEYFNQYIIYPNPASEKITIDNTLDDNCLEEVSLVDFVGRKLATFTKIPQNIGRPQCRWELEIPANIPSGRYLISMLAHNGVKSGRQILIQR